MKRISTSSLPKSRRNQRDDVIIVVDHDNDKGDITITGNHITKRTSTYTNTHTNMESADRMRRLHVPGNSSILDDIDKSIVDLFTVDDRVMVSIPSTVSNQMLVKTKSSFIHSTSSLHDLSYPDIIVNSNSKSKPDSNLNLKSKDSSSPKSKRVSPILNILNYEEDKNEEGEDNVKYEFPKLVLSQLEDISILNYQRCIVKAFNEGDLKLIEKVNQACIHENLESYFYSNGLNHKKYGLQAMNEKYTNLIASHPDGIITMKAQKSIRNNDTLIMRYKVRFQGTRVFGDLFNQFLGLDRNISITEFLDPDMLSSEDMSKEKEKERGILLSGKSVLVYAKIDAMFVVDWSSRKIVKHFSRLHLSSFKASNYT